MPVDAAYEQVIAEQSRASLHFFTRRMFKARKGFRWVNNWHHEAICRALMRVFKGECKRLIINIPPRYSKTEIAVVNFIAWAIGHWPDAEFIHTSYSATLAENNTAAAKALVQSDEYRRIFPEVRIRSDAQSKGDWRTTAGGIVYAAGSGGTITGFGAGKMRAGFGGAIIIDDPHKADEAASDVMRKNVITWFQNTVESRKNDPEHTPIILIMQRLHESDLAGFLIAGGNGEKWELLCLDAIQGEPGNESALWPAKHSLETLRQMERASPYVFNGQYRQRPAPLAGGEFKPDAIGIIEAVPAGTRFVRAWDLAGTEQDGDWTAGPKLGEMPDGRYLIADLVHMRESPEKVAASIRATAERDGSHVPVSVPQDPGQAGKAQVRQYARLLSGFTARSKPVTGDKVTRARPFAAQVNVGNVVMLRAPWNDTIVNEMRGFPNAKHDDIIDGLSLAFDELTTGNTGLLDYYRQQAAEQQKMRAAAEAQNTVHDLRGEDKRQSAGPAAFIGST